MSRKIEFELNDLLSLLLCSEYYEFNHDILYHTLAEKMVTLTDAEIELFLKENSKSQEGEDYSDEELDNIRNYLHTLRDEFIEINE